MSQEWKQERPGWCPHPTCAFRRRAQDAVCGGELPAPVPHDGDLNTHRICLNGADRDGGVLDLQVNATDLGWFRWIFDALDGKRTSWLSRRSPDGAVPETVTAKMLEETELMVGQMRRLLRLLGLGDHARPYSAYSVMEEEIIPAVERLISKREGL